MEKEFENTNVDIESQIKPEKEREINVPTPSHTVVKNTVLSYISDWGGCGNIRNVFPMNYLNAVFGPTGNMIPLLSFKFIWQSDILATTRSIFFQRFMNQAVIPVVQKYKELQEQFKYKMVYDIDDFIWRNPDGSGKALPDYSFCQGNINDEQHTASIEIMNMMDTVCCSTEWIKKFLITECGIKPPVVVVPNTVPQYFYGKNRRRISKKLTKPRIVYTGSPTHYSNKDRLYGDWEGAYPEWIKKNVIDGKIDFMVLGGLPWFFEDIKDKITCLNWLNSYQYHVPLIKWKPDIGIAPLVPNTFNYAKSNIKYLEYCALNAVGIGTIFSNGQVSPYDQNIVKTTENVTSEQLDLMLDEITEPEKFNEILEMQHAQMDENGWWLESPKFVNSLSKIF